MPWLAAACVGELPAGATWHRAADGMASALQDKVHLSVHLFTYCISLLDTLWITLGGLKMPVKKRNDLNNIFFSLKQ